MNTMNQTDFAALLTTAKAGHSFSPEMMRALLDGKKTQTRRPMKDVPEWVESFSDANVGGPWFDGWRIGYSQTHRVKPRYVPGGVYYARETWSGLDNEYHPMPGKPSVVAANASHLTYKADHITGNDGPDVIKWHSPRAFPRWAARCIFRVDDVFPQRVQDITDAQALLEGVDRTNTSIPGYAKKRFENLWNSIYAEQCPWESNPFVWAYSLTVLAIGGTK